MVVIVVVVVVMIVIVIVRMVDLDANRLDPLDSRVTDVTIPCLAVATVSVLKTSGPKADRDNQQCNSDHRSRYHASSRLGVER